MFNSLILSSRRPLPPRCATSSNVSNIASFSMPRARMPSNKARMKASGSPTSASLGILWILTRTVSKLISTRLGGEGMRRGETRHANTYFDSGSWPDGIVGHHRVVG